MTFRITTSRLLVLAIGFSWCLVYEDAFGDLTFGVFAFGCAGVLLVSRLRSVSIVGRSNLVVRAWQYFRNLWLLVVLSWCYGVALGFWRMNDSGSVIRNFFGLILYSFTPLFLGLRMKTRQLVNLLVFGGLVQSAWGVYAVIISGGLSRNLDSGSISDFRSIYSTGFICIFPLFALLLALNLYPDVGQSGSVPRYLNRWGRNPVALFFVGLMLIVPSMSKGFILSAVLLTAILSSAAFMRVILTGKARLAAISTWLSGLVVVVVFLAVSLPMLIDSFSSREPSNQVRQEQAKILSVEFEWIGNGLGARLKSGYARDDAGYGFELTYLNLIHKLGLMAIPLFALYGGTVLFATILLFRAATCIEGAAALGAMGYLVVGAGNPLLLSVVAVSLHLIALTLIDNGMVVLHSDRVNLSSNQPNVAHA